MGIYQDIEKYVPSCEQEEADKKFILAFLKANENAFQIVLFPGGFCNYILGGFYDDLCLFIGDSFAPYKEPVGIHTEGSTSYQGAKIFALLNAEVGCIVRENCIDLIYLIGQGFTQHLQIKNISDFQLRKVGEHLLACHAGVCS